MSYDQLRRNIFELHPLEIRRLLAITVTLDAGGILHVVGTSSSETITINKNGAGKITATGTTSTFTPGTQVNGILIEASGGNDTVQISSNVRFTNGTGIPATIGGGTGNDSLTGGPGNDQLNGNDGDDVLDGAGGNDALTGSAGIDTANYSLRSTPVRADNDGVNDDGEVALGESDNVTCEEIIGGSGNDSLTGGVGQDFLGGGGGNDVLTGGDNNDELTGGAGSDNLQGGPGDDFLQAQDGVHDIVNGGTGPGATDLDLASIDAGIDTAAASRITLGGGNASDLDKSFDTDGLAFDTLGWVNIKHSAVDSQGRIYFVGTQVHTNGNFVEGNDFAVARFTNTGQLDTTFGNAGEAHVDFSNIVGAGYGGNDDDQALGLTIDGSDRIIVVGVTTRGGNRSQMAVARLLDTGALDTGFNTSGKQTIDVVGREGAGYGSSEAVDAAVQRDGKIVVAGNWFSQQSGDSDFAAARLLDSGLLDGTFGQNGSATISRQGANEHAVAVALQDVPPQIGGVKLSAEQNIVIGGTEQFIDAGRDAAIGVFDPGGGHSINDGTGIVYTDFGGAENVADVAVNSVGNIVLVGNIVGPFIGGVKPVGTGQVDALLAVYAPDPSSTEPTFLDQAPTSESGFISFTGVAIDGNDNIVISGNEDSQFIVARYLSNLNIDPSFSSTIVHTPFNIDPEFGSSDSSFAVQVQSDGKIVVGGVGSVSGNQQPWFEVARYKGKAGVAGLDGIEGLVDDGDIHGNPPPDELQDHFDHMSQTAIDYVKWEPDKDGVVRIVLDGRNDNVTLGNVTGGDGNNEIAVNVNGVVHYYDQDHITRIEIYGNGGNDVILGSDDIQVPLVIDGAAGNDILRGGGKNDVLLGGAGFDILDGEAGSDVLVGGADSDLLSGEQGNDILIGGTGADGLLGGTGEDILIAGTTSYDTNVAALNALSAEWSSAASNAVRISHLRGTLAGGLNGSSVLTTATVFNDGIADALTNDSGRDWFFYRNTGAAPVRDQVLFGVGTDEVTLI